MKKKFLSVLFFCMVSVLAGCQINWKTEETVQAPQQVVKTEVETGANLLKTTKTDDQRSASTGSDVLEDNVSEWKTYCNQNMLFEIQYPEDWSSNALILPVKKLDENILFYKYLPDYDYEQYRGITIYVSKSDKRPDFKHNPFEYVESEYHDFLLDTTESISYTYRPNECNNFEEYEKKYNPSICYFHTRIESQNNDLYYTIDLTYPSDEGRKELEKVISTFRFLNNNGQDQCEINLFQSGSDVVNREVFNNGQKRGWIEDNKIFIISNNQVYSFDFDGNFSDLYFYPMEKLDNIFYYKKLGFYGQFYNGPYAIYQPIDFTKITYKCDGSLVFRSSGEHLPYSYCETNGTDYLTQYEYSAAGSGFATGGGYREFWQKIYILNFDGENYVLSGSINGTYLDVDATLLEIIAMYEELLKEGFIKEELLLNPDPRKNTTLTSEEYKQINQQLEPIKKQLSELQSSKEYLGFLIKKPENQERIQEWDAIVRSLKIEN